MKRYQTKFPPTNINASVMDINAAEINKRRVLYELDEDTLSLIRVLYDFLRERDPNFLQQFYDYLWSPDNLASLPLDGEVLARFKESQTAYFSDLIAGNLNNENVQSHLHIWAQHTLNGLPSEWHIKAFNKYLSILTASAAKLLGGYSKKHTDTILALQKLVFFNMDLVANAIACVHHEGGLDQLSGDNLVKSYSYKLFTDRLRQEIDKRQDEDKIFAVLIIHLDGIAKIDGVLGYEFGDLLLQQVADRLRTALRETDFAACISREEFGCILPTITSEEHAILAAYKILRTMETPFTLAGQQMLVSTRLGVSFYPEYGKDTEKLMRQAKLAMHEATRSREGFAIYKADYDLFSQSQSELQMDLHNALEENELLLYFQPVVNLVTGQIISSEALLRWHHGRKGLIPTEKLISMAENIGLISQLTMWVFNTALRQYASCHRAGFDISIAINVPASNLREPYFTDFVGQALRTWNVPPHKIVIELTETAIMEMEDQPKSMETLEKLKGLGVILSMDDFGTGYSSMSRLRTLPFDEIKIDLSFITGMMAAKEDETIVRSIIDLAHNLDLLVVAEGVEDKKTLDYLRKLGCDKAQGFYISPPLRGEEFINMLAHYRKSPS